MKDSGRSRQKAHTSRPTGVQPDGFRAHDRLVCALPSSDLPQHRDQLARTERLLADAERNGNQRLVEMKTPLKLNLVRIIEGLQALQAHEEEADAA